MNDLSFSTEQFSFLFPYFISIGSHEIIESYGSNLAQLCKIAAGEKFSNLFECIRNPNIENVDVNIVIPENELIIIHSLDNPLVYFKGKFEKIINSEKLIFFGSPCYITRNEDIILQFRVIKDAKRDRIFMKGQSGMECFNNLPEAVRYFERLQDDSLINGPEEENEYAITVSNNEGKIEWCNLNFLKLSGYSLNEVKGKRPREVVYGKRSVYVDRDYVDLNVQKGKPFYFENIGYTKKGKEFWFGVTVHPVFNFAHEIIGRIHYLRDISVGKLKELQQEENENLLKLSLETARAGVWSFDLTSGEFKVSDIFRDLIDIGQTDEISLSLLRAMMLPEKDSVFPSATFSELNEDNPRFSFECRMRVNGADRYFSFVGNCIEWTTKKKAVKIVGMLRDITEEKERVLELEKQRKFYERILNVIPSDIAVFDRHHRYLFVNPVGIKDDKLRQWIIGKTDDEYRIYKNKGASLAIERRKVFDEAVRSGHEVEWEEQTTNKQGEVAHHLRKMFPVFNENNELELVIGYGVDITERKKIEEKIRLSESRYRNIFDYSLALICTHDLEGKVLDINNTSLSTLGYSREELIGKSLYLLIPPEKRAEFEKVYLKKIREEGKAEGIVIMMNKRGKYLYLLYQNFLTKDDGEKPYVIGFSQNITDRIEAERALKKSEEKYRNIIANMNMGLLEMDPFEQIVYANNSFCKMSGYEADELIGKSASFIYKDENRHKKSENIHPGTPGETEAYEIKVNSKKGQERWWLISWAPTFDDKGNFSGSIGINLDITLQKTLEQELRKATTDAERSAKAKEIFLANISHEIRTPMNAILGIGRLLSKTNLSGQQKFYHDTIQSAANNLLVIINDLLDFSKIDAGKLTLEHIGFDLKSILDNTILILKHKAEEKGLAITCNSADNIAPVLIGDPYRLNQVFLNLLSNSLKFTERGYVMINCSLIYDDVYAQRLQFQVVDTGIGMSKEYLSHLFDKFSQEDESITRKFGGTGLGMSISKQLIELMGGHIHVQSVKNSGTTISFTIKFPKGKPADLPSAQYVSIDTHILKGKRLLLVEDNEMNRLLANTVLSQYGAAVTEAEDGEKAIEKLDDGVYDLILMDVQMPVKDGLETTRYIRTNIDRNIPIIALTANAYKKEEEICINAGMNDFISKPFDEEKLVQLVARWLGRTIKATAATAKEPELKDKLYDLGMLNTISKGDNNFIKKMVMLFVESMPVAVQQMNQAYDKKDWKSLSAQAHRIKSSIQSMGITALDKDIELLENTKNGNVNKSNLTEPLRRLDAVLKDVISQLKEI